MDHLRSYGIYLVTSNWLYLTRTSVRAGPICIIVVGRFCCNFPTFSVLEGSIWDLILESYIQGYLLTLLVLENLVKVTDFFKFCSDTSVLYRTVFQGQHGGGGLLEASDKEFKVSTIFAAIEVTGFMSHSSIWIPPFSLHLVTVKD
jgi:hypothetical protein